LALSLPRRCATVPTVRGTDALLAARMSAGDDDALAEAFDRFATAVYATAAGVIGTGSAHDVVQDVFVDLWRYPDRYDPDVGSLRTYLTVMARNRAVDILRSELRRIARQQRHYRLTPGEGQPLPGDDLVTADMTAAVRAAIERLPAPQRQVVQLAYFEGMTCREVASAVGIPEGTVKSRLRLALAKLETVLDRQLLESP
jgi:RNA polymerase sigma-70 factor, ECF subfamily